MRLIALGVDHRSAPQEVRQKLAFDEDARSNALSNLKGQFPDAEFALITTCNRVELYAAGDPECVPQVGDLTTALAEIRGIALEEFASSLVDYHDEEAINHLFRVASGLESLVLGEGQIQGQVREAYESAKRSGAVGPILHEVFQQAARVGKRVREQTGLDRGKLSIASVAVDVAKSVFDHFADKTVLVIGLGKMGELTLKHLGALKPGSILVTNRSLPKAEAAANAWGGHALPFDQLEKALTDADVVVSTTASAEPIVTFEQYQRVLKARRYRLSLILDISLPRDFDPRINELETVTLYGIDDLKAQAEANLRGRQKAVGLASELIRQDALACAIAVRHRRRAGAILRQLGDYSEAVRTRELDRLFASRAHLTEDDRQAIALTLHRFQNQLLHHPRAALRTASNDSDKTAHSLIDAVRELFGLGDNSHT